MAFDPLRHHRRSIRLRGYDYAAPGLYFVTVVTYRRRPLFGRVSSGRVLLSACGMIAAEEWRSIATVRPQVELDAFVVMPDHVHGLLLVRGSPRAAAAPFRERSYQGGDAGSLPAILRQYKSVVTKRIRLLPHLQEAVVWQRNYWERVVRTPAERRATRRYIIDNPREWSRTHGA